MYRDRGQADGGAVGAPVDMGPLVRVQISLSRMLWRIGPAWSVLAGALAAGWRPSDANAMLRLIAAVVLGDLVWGALRPVAPGERSRLPAIAAGGAALPYAAVGAPLARLLNSLAAGAGLPAETAWQSVALAAVVAVALSLFLGPMAVLISAAALVALLLAWLVVINRDSYPAPCLALLDVAFPWLLGMALGGEPFSVAGVWLASLVLAGAFTVLQWGILRAWHGNLNAWRGVWVGQMLVLAALVLLRQAWASAVVVVLFAWPSWWLLRGQRRHFALALPWWWAAYAVAALALAWRF